MDYLSPTFIAIIGTGAAISFLLCVCICRVAVYAYRNRHFAVLPEEEARNTVIAESINQTFDVDFSTLEEAARNPSIDSESTAQESYIERPVNPLLLETYEHFLRQGAQFIKVKINQNRESFNSDLIYALYIDKRSEDMGAPRIDRRAKRTKSI